jgi:hypothetical protein
MRDLDEEDGDDGVDPQRSYLFNIQTSISIRAESLDEAEDILEEADDYDNNPNIRVIETEVNYVGED